MDKGIKIPESEIVKTIGEMCAESLSPDVYSLWVDDILPKLRLARQNLKPQKIGMYGETSRVVIGKFIICEQTEPTGETVWIQDEVGGDGGVFPKNELEKVIKEFYDKNL